MKAHHSSVGRVSPHGVGGGAKNAASGDAAYNAMPAVVVGRVPSRGGAGHLKKMGAVWN